MRVLCLGLDGADYDLVSRLLAQGRLPTLAGLAREGTFGALRSTIPAFTPTAWSSFLTGLNPAGHGIFAFTANPNRGGGGRLESAASRAGAPLWRYLAAAGVRSAFVTVPFTHPPEPFSGLIVTGFGGPRRPEIVPLSARNAILTAHPDLRASRHPADLSDFAAAAETLVEHVDEIADVCFLALELEPGLGLLCVDFMSSDIAGHLMWHRLDPTHPAHRGESGDELVRVYEAVDAACGRLVEQAEWLWDEQPTVLVLSDHGMKPTHWLFRANRWLEDAGYLRFHAGTAAGPPDEAAAYAPELEEELVDEQPPFAEIDFGATRAYCFGYGGQIYLGEVAGAEGDRRFTAELADALAEIPHPETGQPAFEVLRKDELYHGFYLDKAPELVLLPRDERIHVDSTRQRWSETFQRHERLFARGTAHFSGQHAVTGILAAAGPGIAVADVPPGSHITQLPATLLALHGLEAQMDAPPIDAILAPDVAGARREVGAVSQEPVERAGAGYTREEEELIVRRLRDLGYE